MRRATFQAIAALAGMTILAAALAIGAALRLPDGAATFACPLCRSGS